MLNNVHIFKFDDSRLFHLRKYTLGFHQTIARLSYIHRKKFFQKLRGRMDVVGGRTQKGIGRVSPISHFFPFLAPAKFCKNRKFSLVGRMEI